MKERTGRPQPFRSLHEPGTGPSQGPDPSALAQLLAEWMHGDESEQRETFEFLRRALDEDRPFAYKLFP